MSKRLSQRDILKQLQENISYGYKYVSREIFGI